MMIAPKGPGHLLEEPILEGSAGTLLNAVHQDPAGKTKEIALAWAKGIGEHGQV